MSRWRKYPPDLMVEWKPRPRVHGNLSYLGELGVPVQIPKVRPRPRVHGNLSYLGELGVPV